MLLLWGIYRKKNPSNTFPCSQPKVSQPPRPGENWVGGKVVKAFQSKWVWYRSREYLGPLGDILPPTKEMCPSATNLRVWQILSVRSDEPEKKKKAPICIFLFKFSSHCLPRLVYWIDGQCQGLHTSISQLNGLFRRHRTGLSGTGQLCHFVKTHKCADNPSNVPWSSQESTHTNYNHKWKHSFLKILLGNRWPGLSHYLCQLHRYFPWLTDVRKVAVVNANFVVKAIYISKPLTFQSIIFKMSSELGLSLGYLLEFFLLQIGWQICWSLATGLKVSKWFIDLVFLPPPPLAHFCFFRNRLAQWHIQDNLRVWFW